MNHTSPRMGITKLDSGHREPALEKAVPPPPPERRLPHPVIIVIVVGIIGAALLVWFIAEMRVGWTG
jgi:hypothetical protein